MIHCTARQLVLVRERVLYHVCVNRHVIGRQIVVKDVPPDVRHAQLEVVPEISVWCVGKKLVTEPTSQVIWELPIEMLERVVLNPSAVVVKVEGGFTTQNATKFAPQQLRRLVLNWLRGAGCRRAPWRRTLDEAFGLDICIVAMINWLIVFGPVMRCRGWLSGIPRLKESPNVIRVECRH